MRKIFIPLVLAVSLGAAGMASAEETTGVVKSVNMDQLTITLQDGSVYSFAHNGTGSNSYPIDAFKAGDHVKITWVDMQGMHKGEAIQAVDG